MAALNRWERAFGVRTIERLSEVCVGRLLAVPGQHASPTLRLGDHGGHPLSPTSLSRHAQRPD
ncbi:MAG TPA: hypothetical protein VGD71_39555 [Kribbella sp.]|jgi:hypothetical protein